MKYLFEGKTGNCDSLVKIMEGLPEKKIMEIFSITC